jgi:hypothetical protein
MLALKDSCVHPTSNKPYIISSSGGTDNSIEGKAVSLGIDLLYVGCRLFRGHILILSMVQNGMTHAFVIEFESTADRDYYVDNDPAHQVFKKLAGEVLEDAQVIDFTNGMFK